MADRTLNLGTLFTGAVDATFTRAVESVEGLVARLEGAVAKANAAAAGMAKGVAGVGPAITPLQKYIGELQKTLAHSPVVMNKATDAATKLAKKYGDSAISIKSWRVALDGVVKSVETVRQRMIAAGKAGDAYANSRNYAAIAEGVIAGKVKATAQGFVSVISQTKKVAKAQDEAGESVEKLVGQYGKAKSKVSEYQKAHGRAETETGTFNAALASTAGHLGKEGSALRVAEMMTRKFEKAIQLTALRLKDSGVNAAIFSESLDRSAIETAWYNRQLSITNRGLVLRNTATARGIGLDEKFASAMGLVVPNARLLNAQYALQNKLMAEVGSRGDNFRKAVLSLGQTFGTSNHEVKGWGTALRRTADAIEITRQRMILAGKNGNAFAASVNVATLATRVQNNQLLASSKGFRQVSTLSEKAAQDISKIPPAMKGGTVAYEAMKRGISQVSVVVGQASAETIRYKSALTQLARQHAPMTIGFDTLRSALNKVERSIAITAYRMNDAGKNGTAFAATANRVAMVNSVLAGRLKATSTGFTAIQKAVEVTKTPLNSYVSLIGKVSGESLRYKAALLQMAREHGLNTVRFKASKTALNQVERAIYATSEQIKAAGHDGEVYARGVDRMSLVNQVLTKTLRATSTGFKQVSTTAIPALTEVQKGAMKSESSLSAFALMQGKAADRTARFRAHLYNLTSGYKVYNSQVENAAKIAFKLEDALEKTGIRLESAGVKIGPFMSGISRAALQNAYLADKVRITAKGLQFYSDESEKAALATAKSVGVSEAFAKNMGLISPATRNAYAHLTEYRNLISELVPQGKQYADAIRMLATTYGRSNKAVAVWGDALREAAKSVEAKRTALNKLGKDGDAYAAKQNVASTAERVLRSNLRWTAEGFVAVQGASNKAGSGLGKFGAGATVVGKQIGRAAAGVDRLMSAFSVVANYAIAAQGFMLVVSAVKETIMSVARFDQVLKDLQAITGGADDAIRIIGNTIKETSDKFVYNADQMSEAARNLAQAGFSAEETLEALPSVATLATTTMEGMRIAADLLTTTIRAFQLNTMESARVADVFAVAANKSKLTIDGLRIVMNYLGPVAHEAGMSLEATAASTMVLADSGIRMSTIGTGLRQVLARMIAPTSAMRAEFEKTGVDINKLNPLTNDFIDVLRELSMGVKDAGAAFRLFGLRGASVAIALINAFRSGAFQKAIDNVYKVGTASVMAAKQMEGIEARAKNLASKVKLLMISLGEGGLKSAMSLVVDVLRTAVTAMTEFVNTTTGRMIAGIAAWTITIWGLTAVLGKLITILGRVAIAAMGANLDLVVTKWQSAIGIIGHLKAALYGLWIAFKAHPFFWIAAAVGGVAVAYNTLKDSTKALTKTWEDTLKGVDSNITKLEFFQEKLANLAGTVGESKEESLAYTAAVQRLGIEFPKMSQSLDTSTASWGKMNDMINEALATEKQNKLRALVSLTELYARQVDEATDPIGAWAREWVKAGQALKTIALSFIFPFSGTAEKYLESVQAADKVAEAMKALGVNSVEAEEALIKLKESLAAYVPALEKAGISSESTVEDIVAALLKLELVADQSEDSAKYVATKIKQYWVDAQKYAKKYADGTAALSTDIPKNYAKMIYTLDALRQVELINASIALDKELDAFRKNADALKLSEEQKWAVIETIRHKHLTKFIEDANKEVVTTQQMALLKEAIHAQELAQIETDYDKRSDVIFKTYLREVQVAGDSAEKKANAELRYNDAVVATNEEKIARTEALNKEHNDFMIKLYEGYIQRYQERTDLLLNLHQELYKAKQEIAEEHYKWDLASLDRNLAKRKAAIEAMAIPENKRTELLKRAEEDYWNASIRLAQKSARERISLLEEEVAREKQIINSRYGDAIKLERDRIKAIEDATGKRLENADREVAAEREKDQKILAIEIKLRDQKVKIYGETLAAFEKYIDDQIREQERLASELKRINGEIRDSEREKMEDIRDIKRMEMNDAQKLQDTKAAFEREMQAGKAALATGDTDEALAAAKRAISLSKEKARETKSLNDEIKRAQKEYADAVEKVSKAESSSTSKSKKSYSERSEAIQDARDDANKAQATLLALGGTIGNEASLINDATNAWDLYRAALDKVKQNTESDMASAGDNIAKTETRVKALKTEMDSLTKQKIQLETGLLPAQIAAVEASIADLKTRLEGIKAQVNLEVIFPENLTQEISDTVDGSIRDMLGGKESKEIPITPKVDMSSAQGAVDTFTGNLTGLEPKLTVDITATGSTEAPIIDKLQEIENKIWELQAIITSGASKMTFDISTPEGRGATEVINEVLTSLQNLAASLGTINLTEVVIGADEVIAQLEQITKLVSDLIALDATVNLNVPMGEYVREMLYDILQTLKMTVSQIWTVAIHVKGLDDLINAKNYIDSLRDKTVYVNVVTRNTGSSSSGRSGSTSSSTSSSPDIVEGSPDKFDWWESRTGGQAPISSAMTQLLSGFGGGDKIKALLEPGEFIIRKEAVQKYGSKLFTALNAMRLATGGYTFDFLKTAKKAGSEATSIKAGLPSVVGAETLQKIRSRIQEYVGATLGRFAKSPQAFTQSVFNAVKNVMRGQYAEINLSTEPARVSSMSGYDTGDTLRRAMGGIVAAVGKIPSHVSAQRLSTGGMAMPKKSRTEESLVVRFQIGDQEYPVAVQDMGSRSMIKQFSRELSKARLTSAR